MRGALASHAAALLGGLVAAEYVDAQAFAYLTPAVVGAGVGAAAQAASGTGRAAARTRAGAQVRVLAAVLAVLGVALGFVLEGSRSPLAAGALVPYALAAAGAVLWTAPPRRARQAAGPD